MKFEVLKKNNLKRNIVIGGCVVLIISAVVLNFTRAKYRSTASVPIVNSTVNYTRPDLNVVAMYQKEDDGEYVSIDTVPTSGYELNTTESYCKVGDEVDNSIPIIYEDGMVSVTFNKKGTKCYLYFDNLITASDTLNKLDLAVSDGIPNFSKTSCSSGCGESTVGIYETIDNDGSTYYFRGDVENNYVYFSEFYWRIIRLNSNGSIRMIYQGETANAAGTDTQIGTSVFNNSGDASYYVGLSYDTTQHGTGTNSTILTVLNDWFSKSGLNNYTQYIDSDVGFCSDRNMASEYNWSIKPNEVIRYAAFERLYTNKNPSLECSDEDILKIPVGLITADEVSFAGGVFGINNNNYYLTTGLHYWTMTPSNYGSSSRANNFQVGLNGNLTDSLGVYDSLGVRPVINLKANTIFTGTGTSTDPFVVA